MPALISILLIDMASPYQKNGHPQGVPLQIRFIADVMLGRLARWLRILGFDTVYFRAIGDNELVRTARQQERILLTRDTGIAKRMGHPKKPPEQFILIHSNDTFEQLKEVLTFFLPAVLNEGGRQPRCAVCNGELASAAKEVVAGRIPEYVFLNAASFFTCSECGKVYWNGSHKKSIDSRVEEILGSVCKVPRHEIERRFSGQGGRGKEPGGVAELR